MSRRTHNIRISPLVVVVFASIFFFLIPMASLAAQATLAWDANDPAPEGYCIYQRTEGQSYDYNHPVWTGSVTTGTVPNLDYGTTYYFVVRAFEGDQSSIDSNEVTFFAQSPPSASHTITVVAGGNGSVTPNASVTMDSGASQTFSISPDAGYHVADVKVDGVSIGAVSAYTFSQITANHTITASFAVDTYVLSAVAGVNGSVSPAGSVDVNHGESLTFSFSADTGYHVADVLVDGQSMGAVGSYTFGDVAGDHDIAVSFAENSDVAIWIEAEDGDLHWPMEINDDFNASAGGFIWVPTGNGNWGTLSEEGGSVVYHFEVPEAGDYVIWGRHMSNDSASGSFFISMDGQAEIVWHTEQDSQNMWTWDKVSAAAGTSLVAEPIHFQLAAGTHTLTLYQREDGTMLDQLLVTNQLDMESPDNKTIEEMMEFGEVRINHNWTRVTFEKSFANPVVVAGPISLNGGHPAVTRIRNVDGNGFDIRIQEWDYLDGFHLTETVSYLVMEEGSHTLVDGTRIEAVNLASSAAAYFETISFNKTFNEVPIIMTSVCSVNDAAAVTGRVKSVTIDSFKYRLQEQELNAKDHGMENVAYIAWEPSVGMIGNTVYRIDRTADAVRARNYNVSFDMQFATAPVFLADMQTTDGDNTANVRCNNKDTLSVDVLIDEEQSKDNEVSHMTEIVGFMIFGDLM